jgi:ABC-type polysaccharide/polyol phosphate export permease
MGKYSKTFMNEKYWKTLSATLIAPVNRFTLLIGTLISELLMISIPLALFLIITYILYPISIIHLLLFFSIFFLIYLLFAGIGLIIGVLTMSYEELVPWCQLFLRFTFLLACISYPKEIFPEFVQNIVVLNPLYYIFELLRLSWYLGINQEETLAILTPFHFILLISITLFTVIISLYFFEFIYKKYGIQGY